MPTGLIRRNASYSLRRRIPLDLIATYNGRKEIVRALGTKDREEAKRLHAEAWVALDREFASARQIAGPDPAPPPTPEVGMREKIRQILAANAGKPRPLLTSDEAIYQVEQAELSFRECFEEETRYEQREFARLKLLAVLNVADPDILSEEQMALRDLLSDAKWDLEQTKAQLASAENRSAPLDAPRPAPVATASVSQTSTLKDVIDRWARERQPTEKTVRAHISVIDWFIARTGVDRADMVEPTHVQHFKRALISEGTSAPNIKTKLSRLRTIMSFAEQEGTITTNPAKDVQAPPSKGGKARLPWSTNDLNALFAGEVHAAGARPVRGKGEAAYWLPILGLFTGARREELGQLRHSDIVQVAYDDDGTDKVAWHIKIGQDAQGRNHLKTASSERMVPLHPKIIDLGFLRYVDTRGTDELLFDLKPNRDGRLTEKWGEWFREYRRACGITDPRINFHSFRHTFKDFCRESGIEEGVQRQMMGHSARDVADGYGNGFSTLAMVKAISRYRIPRLKLASPPQSSTSLISG